MKKLFLYLLEKYSRNESQRIEIYKTLFRKMEDEYREQSHAGNVHNATIEFLISNPIVKRAANLNDKISLGIIKRNFENAYPVAIDAISTLKN
jgi:hypothetical protein